MSVPSLVGWRNRIVRSGDAALSAIVANPANWRTHPKLQADALSSVLSEVGYVQQVVINARSGRLVDGHLRVQLAEQHGETSVPAVWVDLDDAEERLILATLDPLAAMAETNRDALSSLLGDLAERGDALGEMLAGLAKSVGLDGRGNPAEDHGTQLDRADELRQKWGTDTGQLWEIGRHRLLCGDATSAEDVARVMADERARLFATDPPYGIDFGTPGLHNYGPYYEPMANDHLKGDAYQSWLESAFQAWMPHLADDAAWYLWHPMVTQGYFAAAAATAGVIISRQIIWAKAQFILGRGEYHWQHELCFYGWRQGSRPRFFGERNQTTVWVIAHETTVAERDHRTQKPAELFAIPMRNHTVDDDVCAEPFAGSGAQLVAAEQEGRTCYGMEIEPKYVAVALERLAGMGLTPRLL